MMMMTTEKMRNCQREKDFSSNEKKKTTSLDQFISFVIETLTHLRLLIRFMKPSLFFHPKKSEFHPHILKETPIRWWRWSLSTESSFSKIFFSFSFVLFRFVPLIVLIFLHLAANHSTNRFRVFFSFSSRMRKSKRERGQRKELFVETNNQHECVIPIETEEWQKLSSGVISNFFVEFCALPDDAEERKQNSPDFLFNHFSDHNNWSSSSQLQSEGFQKKTRIIFVCLYKPTKQQKKRQLSIVKPNKIRKKKQSNKIVFKLSIIFCRMILFL